MGKVINPMLYSAEVICTSHLTELFHSSQMAIA